MPTHIHSNQNERIKRVARLRDRRGRHQQQRIIVDGLREVCRALTAGVTPREVYVSETQWHDAEIQAILRKLPASVVEVAQVAPAVFSRIAYGNRMEGIVLVADQPQRNLKQVELPDDALICVVERVEKPGNLGAIIRTADAAGLDAVLIADGGTDLYNPNAIRASLGAIFHTPVCAATADEILAWLTAECFKIYAARVGATQLYSEVNLCGRAAFVLGSEADGLTDIWDDKQVTPIGLPMRGIVDSLNVSVTAAILCYEACRQRQDRHGKSD